MTRKGVWNLQQLRDKSLQTLWNNESEIWTCGANVGDYSGALGNNEGRIGMNPSYANQGPGYRSSPVQVFGTNTEWTDIQTDPSGSAMYALKSDNTLWGWGKNTRGQFGPPSDLSYSSPVSISAQWGDTASDISDYSSAGYNLAWINGDNELWIIGQGSSGDLANSRSEDNPSPWVFSSPVQVPGSWSKISGGDQYYAGIKTNGELWTWGRSTNGNLGHNEAGNSSSGAWYSSPVQVPGTTWSKAYARSACMYALKTDNTLWGWGANNQAQMSVNNKTSYSSPVQIPGSWSNVIFSKGTGNNRFYIESDGSMYQGGQNYNGNLGQGVADNTLLSSPIQIPGTWSTEYRPVMNNNATVAAVKSNGTLWVWGINQYGQFGLNSVNDGYSSPVQLGGTTEFIWNDIAISQVNFGGIRKTLTSSQE